MCMFALIILSQFIAGFGELLPTNNTLILLGAHKSIEVPRRLNRRRAAKVDL